jgi:hypothetical protein
MNQTERALSLYEKEIDDLRAENERLKQTRTAVKADMERRCLDLEAEIEWLRAALEHIAESAHDDCNAWDGLVAHTRNVARVALGREATHEGRDPLGRTKAS